MPIIRKSPHTTTATRSLVCFGDGGRKPKSTKLVEQPGVPTLGGLGARGGPAVNRRTQVAGFGAVARAVSQEAVIMAGPAGALSGILAGTAVLTRDAGRVVDPEYEWVRLAHELSDAALRNAPRACRIVRSAVPLEMAEVISRLASGGGRLQA